MILFLLYCCGFNTPPPPPRLREIPNKIFYMNRYGTKSGKARGARRADEKIYCYTHENDFIPNNIFFYYIKISAVEKINTIYYYGI